jgi:hypothetical protein
VVATIGERKVDDGDWVTFPADASYWPLYDQSGVLPLITVNAVERDADGLAEFCSMGVFVTDQAGSNGDCDVKWNGGSSGIYFVDQLGSLPSCTDFGADAAWADHGCMVLESAPNGDDYPSITALVAIRVH